MKYVLLNESNVVIQVQPYKEDGFVECEDHVVCGMVKDGDAFIVPPMSNEVMEMIAKQEALSYLASTDWYVTRFTETGAAIPDDIRVKRQEAREIL